MSMYTHSEKKEKIKDNKKNIILHFTWSYEQKQNTPYIVICDLSTVLDLRPLHSFTYDTVYWYSHTLVYRIALQHSDNKTKGARAWISSVKRQDITSSSAYFIFFYFCCCFWSTGNAGKTASQPPVSTKKTSPTMTRIAKIPGTIKVGKFLREFMGINKGNLRRKRK